MVLQLYMREDQPGVPYVRVCAADGKELLLDAPVRQVLDGAPWNPVSLQSVPRFTHLWTCAVLNGVESSSGLSPSDAQRVLGFVTQRLLVDP